MDTLFQELKKAREAKGIPLAQISDITRITEEYLEAIEDGNVKILPQAYVRAFIREYADVIGLSPDDIMARYDSLSSTTGPKPPSSTPAETEHTPSPALPSITPEKKSSLLNATTARIALSIVAVGILLIIAWNLTGRKSGPSVEEVPFQTVIKQEEQRLAPSQTNPQAVPPVVPTPSLSAATPADSLLLRTSTLDSIWIMIIIDQQQPKEYLFPPNAKASWKARDRFLVTLGNAGAAEFTLNKQPLGPLGKRGVVLRNYEISRKNLTTR
jgi:cytoskeletal protein RodZ